MSDFESKCCVVARYETISLPWRPFNRTSLFSPLFDLKNGLWNKSLTSYLSWREVYHHYNQKRVQLTRRYHRLAQGHLVLAKFAAPWPELIYHTKLSLVVQSLYENKSLGDKPTCSQGSQICQ